MGKSVNRSKELMHDWMGSMAAVLKELEDRAIVAISKRMLPPAIQAQILESIEAERAAVLERIRMLEHSLEILEGHLQQARQQTRATYAEVVTRPLQERVRLDGTRYEKPAQVARMATPETVKANQAAHAISREITRHRTELTHRQVEMHDLQVLERQVRAGITAGLLTITQNWRNSTVVGGLAPLARVGQSFQQTDRFGNDLPLEAQDG